MDSQNGVPSALEPQSEVTPGPPVLETTPKGFDESHIPSDNLLKACAKVRWWLPSWNSTRRLHESFRRQLLSKQSSVENEYLARVEIIA